MGECLLYKVLIIYLDLPVFEQRAHKRDYKLEGYGTHGPDDAVVQDQPRKSSETAAVPGPSFILGSFFLEEML